MHGLPPRKQKHVNRALCGTLPTGTLVGNSTAYKGEVDYWCETGDPIDCKRCIERMEKIVSDLLVLNEVPYINLI